MTLSRVVVIVAVTAAIVYAGLNVLMPRKDGRDATVDTADAGFVDAATPAAGEADADAAAAEPEATPEGGAETETAAAEPTSETASETPPAPDGGADGEDTALTAAEGQQIAETVANGVVERMTGAAPDPAAAAAVSTDAGAVLDEAAAREIAAAVARRAAGGAPAAAATGPALADDGALLTEAEARQIDAAVARRQADAAGDSAAGVADADADDVANDAEVADDTVIAADDRAEMAAPEPVETAEAVAPAAPAAVEPEASTLTAAPAPPAPRPAKPRKPSPKPSGKLGAGTDVLKAWWLANPRSGGLNLVYVGQAAGEKTAVLLFDRDVAAATANADIQLLDTSGKAASGEWTQGNNGRVLAFKGLKAGRYTVIVAPTTAAGDGATAGRELVGPVYIR